MRVLKAILLFIMIIIGVLVFLELIPIAPEYPKENLWIIEKGSRPLIVPHAGAKELYPESTKYAFRKLYEDGYDVFEVDLVITKDGYLISHHDVTLTRLTGYNEYVKDLTLAEVEQRFKSSNFGKNLPNYDAIKDELVPATLNYLFDTYPNMLYIIEIKDTETNSGKETMESAVTTLINLIKEKQMEKQVIVASFDDAVTKLVKASSDLMTGTAVKETLKFVMLSFLKVDFFYRPQDSALIIPFKDDIDESQRGLLEKVPGFIRKRLTTYDETNDIYYTNLVKQYIINDAHRHNMAVLYWTVNDKEEMKRLIEMGVDGIITDRPDLLMEVYEELGLK